MELSRENLRVMIYYDCRRGLSRQECIDQLISTFGDVAPFDHVTYCEIEATVVISSTSIYKIFHKYLAVKKIFSRWIPHNLTKSCFGDSQVEWKKCYDIWFERMQKCDHKGEYFEKH